MKRLRSDHEKESNREKKVKGSYIISQNIETILTKQNLSENSCSKIKRYHQTKELNAFNYVQEEKSILKEVKKKETLTEREIQNQALFGCFLAVKDNISVQNYPNSAGTPALREWKPKKNAPVVQKLLDNGCIFFGKTNMDELAYGVASKNVTFGNAKNPHHSKFIPGGSSGGSAISVVTGVTDIALGTDTTGSVRIPAALCGCCGFKPSFSRYPMEGVVPLSKTRDVVGVLARTVRDIIKVDNILVSKEKKLQIIEDDNFDFKSLRIGIPEVHFYDLSKNQNVEVVVKNFLKKMEKLGISLIRKNFPRGTTAMMQGNKDLEYECKRALFDYLKDNRCPISLEEVINNISSKGIQDNYGKTVSKKDYDLRMAEREEIRGVVKSYFEKNTVSLIMFPTVKLTAIPIDSMSSRDTLKIFSNTILGSLIGFPSISIPIGKTMDTSLPVGIEIMARKGDDKYELIINA